MFKSVSGLKSHEVYFKDGRCTRGNACSRDLRCLKESVADYAHGEHELEAVRWPLSTQEDKLFVA